VEREVHVWRATLGATDRRAVARAALDSVLARYLGGEAPALERAPRGKPRLAEAPERLSFSLSHSGGLALIAVTPDGGEVGVDVERLRPRRDLVRLAARWLPQEDAEAVARASAQEREATFYAAWTRFEARAKCTGAGLSAPPPGPEIVALPLDIDPGYAAAVAADASSAAFAGADRAARFSVRRFDLSE
jgi:4'-phosphopantetheinyl transferase